jgi:hypothetical protein
MNISKWKVVWKFITGGGVGVVDYLLTVLKNALNGLGDATKEKIQAVLNLAMKILSIAQAVRIFIPVKYQLAYDLTIKALQTLVASMQDLEITGAELQALINGYNEAYAAWMSSDDETCVDLVEGPGGTFAARSYRA